MCLLSSSWSDWAPAKYLEDDLVKIRGDKGMVKPVKKLVRQIVRQIDEITGLEIDFKFSDNIFAEADSDILIYGVDKWTGELAEYNDMAGGLAFHRDDVSHATWRDKYVVGEEEVYGKKGRLKRVKPSFVGERSKHIIGHEILHTFGLSHPNDDGYDNNFNSDSTLMSYFFTGSYSGLGPLDEAALSDLWGAA